MRSLASLSALLIVIACGDKGPRLDAPVVTTLPNGAVDVKNSGPSGWADTSGWRLVELYRVGGADAEGRGPEELVDPQSVALDPAGGIYVVDQKPAVVKQFSPTGQYVRSFGREGRGPGEFQVGFVATGPGVFVLHDPQSSRTSVFDSAGAFLRGWASSCCYWSSIMVSRDTLIYIPTSGGRTPEGERAKRHYIRYRLDGTLVDTLRILNPAVADEPEWVLTGGSGNNKMMMSTSVPLAAGATWALDPAGGALFAWTGDYRFVASRTGLDTTQVISLAAKPATVTDERRAQIRDSMVSQFDKQFDHDAVAEAFRLSDIPSAAPYFESIQVDGRRNRWLRPDDGGNRAVARFDVFDSTGAYLGAVPVPHVFGLSWNTAWSADRVATIAEDDDGLPVVVVYRIERR